MITIRNFTVVKIAITCFAALAVFTFKQMFHIRSGFPLVYLLVEERSSQSPITELLTAAQYISPKKGSQRVL